MRKIIDVVEVQRELDRAARDGKRGTVDVRAGRFVHRDAAAAKVMIAKEPPAEESSNGRRPRRARRA